MKKRSLPLNTKDNDLNTPSISMPEDWHPLENNSNELIGICEKIKTEKELVDDRHRIYDQRKNHINS